MIKMIVTDLDGSLLDDQKQLPKTFNDVFKLLKSKGIKLVIATGRSYYNVAEIFSEYLSDIIFICENGCQIVENNKTIYSASLDNALIVDVFNKFKTINKGVMLPCGSMGTYNVISSNNEKDYNEVVKYYKNFIELDDINDINDEIYKISFCCVDGTHEHLLDHLICFNDQADVYVSAKQWMDITKKDESKGKALAIVQRSNHIRVDDTICFGDYVNDLSMADYVSTSFCMLDGHQLVKEKFDFIIGSNNDGAVINKIKELVCE